jgi:hypothetical protein
MSDFIPWQMFLHRGVIVMNVERERGREWIGLVGLTNSCVCVLAVGVVVERVRRNVA